VNDVARQYGEARARRAAREEAAAVRLRAEGERWLAEAVAARPQGWQPPGETVTPACWSWAPYDLSHLPDPEALIRSGLKRYEDDAHRLWTDWHEGRCAVCGAIHGERLFRDHDHTTGLVRGLLCPSCNARESHRSPFPVYLKYRERHPAGILGIRVRYRSTMRGRLDASRVRPRRHSGGLTGRGKEGGDRDDTRTRANWRRGDVLPRLP
jgi:Recombination endonuclease VII